MYRIRLTNCFSFNSKTIRFKSVCLFLLLSSRILCAAQVSSETISLTEHHSLIPTGAYRLQGGTFGTSRIAYTQGKIGVSENESTLYIAGHAQHYSIGAFDISQFPPQLGSMEDIPISPNIEPFVTIAPIQKEQLTADRITGIYLNNNSLLVGVDEYYDANGDNNENLVIFSSSTDLTNAKQKGYYPLKGRSHAAGWMGQLPNNLATLFNTTNFLGSSSQLPINSRLSIGPTLFLWDAPTSFEIPPIGREINTIPIIDYSLANPLHTDQYNESGENDLWTELSYAAVAFFAPQSNDYIVIGRSGGHESGIGYKIVQDNGNVCGGPCAFRHDDYYNYFWVYKKEDIVASFNGEISPHSLIPYAYGKLPNIIDNHAILGGDYIEASSTLYLLIGSADTLQSNYEPQPVIVTYKVNYQ